MGVSGEGKEGEDREGGGGRPLIILQKMQEANEAMVRGM